jgi:hypothetical protein
MVKIASGRSKGLVKKILEILFETFGKKEDGKLDLNVKSEGIKRRISMVKGS